MSDAADMLTAPQLMAVALGRALDSGPHRCAYCGASCSDVRPAAIAKTFTDRPRLACADSPYRCAGCQVAMDERATVPSKDKPQKTRNYSLIIDRTVQYLTKANLDIMRAVCTAPPRPPFAICLSDSGQRHLLFRTPVNWCQGIVTVTLEGEPITFRPADLQDRLDLCKRIAAASGKPSLKAWSSSSSIAVMEYWPDGWREIVKQYSGVHRDALSRLATWLTPNRKDCRSAYETGK